MISEVVILAGGQGSRLQPVIQDMPKAMAEVNGHPFLTYILDFFNQWGLEKVILAVGYKHELITEYYKDSYKSLQIQYAVEDEPLGTGGAIKNAMAKTTSHNILVLNGDTYFDVNLQKLIDFHRMKESDMVMALRYVEDTSRYGSIIFDENNRITGFTEKGESKEPGYINGGMYLINKSFFDSLELGDKFSFEKDVIEKHYQDQHIFGVRCFSYFIDIGVPNDYERAQHEFKRFLV